MKRIFLFVLMLFFLGGLISGETVYADQALKKATFAGGCFWCMESDFEKVGGVKDVVSGYEGGAGANPTYKDYTEKGHIEVVQIVYDPSLITYTGLLDLFWHKVDPTDAGGQFCDRGHAYTTAIFYHTQEQKQLAEKSKELLARSGKLKEPVVTPVIEASTFYPAEDYHQDYYKKNPIKYKLYRFHCGRDRRRKKVWGGDISMEEPKDNPSKYSKPDKKELKKKLTPLQYKVTQEKGTEPAFKNEYWDNKKDGIYVDIVSGEPVFSSRDKYKSGTGWPSFTKPLVPGNIIEKEDKGWFAVRTEIRSKQADSHLGHVFDDGPQPTGLRYCMNSAALRFIPKEDLKKEGYEEYEKLFEN